MSYSGDGFYGTIYNDTHANLLALADECWFLVPETGSRNISFSVRELFITLCD